MIRLLSIRRLPISTLSVLRPSTVIAHNSLLNNNTSKMSKHNSTQAKQRKKFHKRTKREKGDFKGTNEDVLKADVQDLLEAHRISPDANSGAPTADENLLSNEGQGLGPLPERFSELDVRIEVISSTGDGLGFSDSRDHVYVVPFSFPGDVIRSKVITHFESEGYSLTDFLEVKEAGPLRDDSLIKCPHFSKCSGCQLQAIPYDKQLAHKKDIVERAYRHFSNLTPETIPSVEDTMASPLQYSYRTKLTPHFDGPPNSRRDKRSGIKPAFSEVPPIGFMLKGTRKTLDIEDCPIGTDVVRQGIKSERERVKREIGKYSRGATLLLRESTEREKQTAEDGKPVYKYTKTCITDNNGTSKEYIGDFVFTNTAGAFFQNNNSILPEFTNYVRELVTAPLSSTSDPPITHLIDAYCGSGLFTICLSPLGLKSIGIDISASSIEAAQKNAELNNLPPDSASFMAADAAAIFADVKSSPDQTVVIIDPPRKGCDQSFLDQLLAFGPKRIVYVSCNVHTQARDVAVLVEGKRFNKQGEEKTARYNLKSLRGLDFFPQTGHVEGAALLERVVD